MTTRISPVKGRKILRLYFAGLQQEAVAARTGVNQATVSRCAGQFKQAASINGITQIAKGYEMQDEIESLRTLAVELNKEGMTSWDAREGVGIIKKFLKLGVNPDKHLELVDVCKKLNSPGFLPAAMELSQAEQQSGLSYAEAVAKYQNSVAEFTQLRSKLEEGLGHLSKLKEQIDQQEDELHKLEHKVKQKQTDMKIKEVELEKQLQEHMKHFNVNAGEIKAVAHLKSELEAAGLDLNTLIKLAEGVLNDEGKQNKQPDKKGP